MGLTGVGVRFGGMPVRDPELAAFVTRMQERVAAMAPDPELDAIANSDASLPEKMRSTVRILTDRHRKEMRERGYSEEAIDRQVRLLLEGVELHIEQALADAPES